MKRCVMIALAALVLTLALGAGNVRAESAKPFHVHFTVVPAVLPDGSDPGPALVEFRAEVVKLAGGYTELGPSRGGAMHAGAVVHEENIAFLIGADRDLSVELKALVRRLFGEANVFILAWPAKATF